jgi:antitoxin component YwqK of YwqJK toxin-antitoxin module
MNEYNEQGQQHGPWEKYYRNGKLWYKGSFINGQRHGLWEDYYPNDNLYYKGNYVNGEPNGIFEWNWAHGLLDVIQYHIR